MGKEVEMKDADDKSKMVEDSKPEAETSSPQLTVAEQLAANVKLIEKAVKQKETGVLFSKLLRQTQALRRRLTSHDVQAFVRSVLPQTHAAHSIILDHLKQASANSGDGANI